MSRQPRNNSSTPAAPSATRMNEYFVPRDGIDREVISADICRYLGNDALVRPGHYEDPATGQIVQGYYITAYRNLTTAMIEDLKADSARWDNERRTQSTRNTNAPGGQYRYSETHQSRQNQGPTSDMPFQPEAYNRDSYDGAARYPGTGSAGYKGAAGTAYTMHNIQGHQGQNYGPPSGGNYGPGYQQNQPPPPPPGQDMRFAQHQGQHPGFKMEDTPYVAAGTNMSASRPFQGDGYNAPRGAAVPIPQPTYAPPVQSHAGYTTQSNSTFTQPHPQDMGYGRASPAGPQQGYSQTTQYEDSAPSRSTASPAQNQNQPKDSSNNGRRFERESERPSFDRHQRPPPRR